MEKHVDLFEHWFASKKGQGTQCSPHRHSTQTQVELSQVASIIHECNQPMKLDSCGWMPLPNNLKLHIGSIKVSHLVAGSLPLLAAFASPFSLLQQVLLPLALFFQKAHAPPGDGFLLQQKNASLGTHQETNPLSHCCHQLGDACMGW